MNNSLPVLVALILGSALAVAVITLRLLLSVPPSQSRNLSLLLMAMVVPASLMMLASMVLQEGALALATSLCGDLLIYWSVPVILLMVISIVRPGGKVLSRGIYIVVFIPMMVLTLLILGEGILNPEGILMVTSTTPPWVSLGNLNVGFLGLGMIYFISIIILVVQKLLKDSHEMRTELLEVLVIFIFVFVLLVVVSVFFPAVSISIIYPLLTSLLGLVLSRASLMKSDFIMPRKEKTVVERAVSMLSPSGTYLFLNERGQARELFGLYVKTGMPGLWVTRRPPHEARKTYGLVETQFIWLTGKCVPGEVCVEPRDLGRLGRLIGTFMESAERYIILIEGLEYLSASVGFSSLLSLIHLLNDKVMSGGGILLLGFDPKAFKDSELALLKSEATQVFEEPPPPAGRAPGERPGAEAI
ncbi:MAG: DUF835 domain-containing protein [Thermoplasmata archaeon]